MSDEYQQDLATLRAITEAEDPTEEDREVLATLAEALEDITKDYIIQVGLAENRVC